MVLANLSDSVVTCVDPFTSKCTTWGGNLPVHPDLGVIL